MPAGPRHTAALPMRWICRSRSSCQACPGGSSHSSSQGRMPRAFRPSPSRFTAALSAELWQRKTSKRPASRLRRTASAMGLSAAAGGGAWDGSSRGAAAERRSCRGGVGRWRRAQPLLARRQAPWRPCRARPRWLRPRRRRGTIAGSERAVERGAALPPSLAHAIDTSAPTPARTSACAASACGARVASAGRRPAAAPAAAAPARPGAAAWPGPAR